MTETTGFRSVVGEADAALDQSFTSQAPGFYEKQGYREIFRWEGVPTPDADDVHFRKEL